MLRTREIPPLPVHACIVKAALWAHPTPEMYGQGWKFQVSEFDSFSSRELILMTDGTFRLAYDVRQLSAGKTRRTLGVARTYWPKGAFHAAWESHDWSRVHIESVRAGMVRFLREN